MKFWIVSFVALSSLFLLVWCGSTEEKTKNIQSENDRDNIYVVDEAEQMCKDSGGTYQLLYSEEYWNYSECSFENGATWVDYKDFGDFFEN